MPTTYGSIWRKASLYVPGAPPVLVMSWADRVFQRVLEHRDAWSWLRRVGELRFPALATVTGHVTQGSTSVAGAFPSTMTGRQVRLPGQPIYTILSADGSTATLDRVWAGATNPTAALLVYLAYPTMPEGFIRWLTLTDVETQHRVVLKSTEQEIAIRDPKREHLGGWPVHLVSYLPDADGRPRYEAWPHVTTASVFTGMYLVEGSVPDEDTTLPWPLSEDLLLEGTLAEAASWPGTTELRNPYFNLVLARAKQDRFEALLHSAEVSDEDRYLTWEVIEGARGGVSAGLFPRMAFDD